MSDFQLRLASVSDLDGIFAIYDREVLEGSATFDTEVYSPAQRLAWFGRHLPPRYPIYVAERAQLIAGWGSLSPWSDRRAYDRAAELSVYVHPSHQSQGLGKALALQLLAAGGQGGLGVVLSRITSESTASLALHTQLGFRHAGTLRRVGEKFGRVLDVELFELHL